jgi:hypothetical protein
MSIIPTPTETTLNSQETRKIWKNFYITSCPEEHRNNIDNDFDEELNGILSKAFVSFPVTINIYELIDEVSELGINATIFNSEPMFWYGAFLACMERLMDKGWEVRYSIRQVKKGWVNLVIIDIPR